MLFSAKLRLPADVTPDVLTDFVNEIMEVVELTPLRNALVGLPGVRLPRNGVAVRQSVCARIAEFLSSVSLLAILLACPSLHIS